MGLLHRFCSRETALNIEWGIVRKLLLKKRLIRLKKKLREFKAEKVVFFLNSMEIIMLAKPILNELKIPYTTMEWDLFEEGIHNNPVGRRFAEELRKDAEKLRRGADSRGVASEGMQRFYQKQFGLNAIILRQAMTVEGIKKNRPAGKDFVIIICGNIYAIKEFHSFIKALDILNWNCGGRKIIIQWVGAPSLRDGELPDAVQTYSWLSFAESLEFVAQSDLGYCPYWFDPEKSALAETSFPSKLVSYLSCHVPIFYHGPNNGSPAVFLNKYQAGFICAEQDPLRIADCIASVLSNDKRMLAARSAAIQAIQEEFTLSSFEKKTHQLLDSPYECNA